jgi:cytochrome P450
LQKEVECFLKELENFNGAPTDVLPILSTSICNNICSLGFGERFDYKDPDFINVTECVDKLYAFTSNVSIHSMFPWLISIPFVPTLIGDDDAKRANYDIDAFIKKISDRHKETYIPGQMRSYIDAFIAKRSEIEGNAEKAVLDRFDDKTMVIDLRVLFFAGTETTTSQIRWGLLYLMSHPDIQTKIQQEIDEVVGRHHMPSMEDKLRMPYVDAFIMEITRKATLAPLGFYHRVLQDVEVNGYLIPEGTIATQNLWAVHHDPKLWGDPFSFRPERFINEKGQAVKPEYLIPFGIGKRYCLGEPLARMELFLYITAILQKFTILPPEDAIISFDEILTIVSAPKPFRLRAVLRE